jgi:hypothetical protein
MPICSSNTETDAQILSTYDTPYTPSSLPNGGVGWTGSSVDATTGMVSSAAVDAQVVILISNNEANAPTAPVNNQSSTSLSETNLNAASTFSTKSAALRTKINTEYCYYYRRYTWALRDVLDKAVNNTATQITAWNADTNSDYYKRKLAAEQINRKLNQLIQILQSLVNNRLTTLNSYYGTNSGVNKINEELNTIRSKLQSDSQKLKDSQMETNVKTSMMEYTIEKNNASRNMLAIYGFLNIIAVGMVYFLYKNIK